MWKVKTQGIRQMMGKGIQTTPDQSNIGIKVQNGSKIDNTYDPPRMVFQGLVGQ